MPQVSNINNNYSVNNRRSSSKLSFQVGERFHGKVAKIGNGNEVVVKLADGWQFSAIVEEGLDSSVPSNMQLQVEGYENGQLKLKIIKNENREEGVKDSAQAALEKEGFSLKDKDILKAMLKYNIPLKQENIIFIKSLLDFSEKINIDGNEVSDFIGKFLESKGILPLSVEGLEIKEVLQKFFTTFKELSSDEILFFVENDIEFTTENIKSFKEYFTSEDGTTKLFNNIKSELGVLDIKEGNEIEGLFKTIEKDTTVKELSQIKEGDHTLASKVYDANSSSNGKVSMLAVLKSMVGVDNNNIKQPIKNVIQNIIENNKEVFTAKEYNTLLTTLSNKSDEEILREVFNGQVSKDEPITKESLTKVLSNLFGKEITLNEGDFSKLKESMEFKLVQNNVVEEKVISTSTKTLVLENKDQLINVGNNIKDNINVKVNDIKDIIKELLVSTKEEGGTSDKIISLIKSNINHFKLFNTISSEYYYLDVPVTREDVDYPCKLIIKDKRKDGKKIDSTYVKIVLSVKTINLGLIDGFLTVKDKGIDVELKCDEKYMKIFEAAKEKLYNDLQSLGFSINIKVSKKENDINLVSCREFFNDGEVASVDIMV